MPPSACALQKSIRNGAAVVVIRGRVLIFALEYFLGLGAMERHKCVTSGIPSWRIGPGPTFARFWQRPRFRPSLEIACGHLLEEVLKTGQISMFDVFSCLVDPKPHDQFWSLGLWP